MHLRVQSQTACFAHRCETWGSAATIVAASPVSGFLGFYCMTDSSGYDSGYFRDYREMHVDGGNLTDITSPCTLTGLADGVHKIGVVRGLLDMGHISPGWQNMLSGGLTRLLEQDELVAVFPEGYKGVGKLYKDRYRLARFGRGGPPRGRGPAAPGRGPARPAPRAPRARSTPERWPGSPWRRRRDRVARPARCRGCRRPRSRLQLPLGHLDPADQRYASPPRRIAPSWAQGHFTASRPAPEAATPFFRARRPTRSASRDNLNVKGAFLHMWGDTLSSVGVVVAGAIILATSPDAEALSTDCSRDERARTFAAN
jgi:Co/Zn/Cd efflux system component